MPTSRPVGCILGLAAAVTTAPNGDTYASHNDAFGHEIRRDRAASATRTAVTRHAGAAAISASDAGVSGAGLSRP